MSDPQSIDFKVGETFANRRGSYEILEIDGGTMRVRYVDTLEEAELNVEMQRKILANIAGDAHFRELQEAAEIARQSKGMGGDFEGLLETDFKSTVGGTKWRGRPGMGGRVARRLGELTRRPFSSVPVPRWPAVFFADRPAEAMDNAEKLTPIAKFTVELDAEGLYYGFYIEKGSGKLDGKWDWSRLVAALDSDPELAAVVEAAEAQEGVTLVGRRATSNDHFHYRGAEDHCETLWPESAEEATPLKERIGQLQAIKPKQWGELYLMKHTPKAEAIAAEQEMGETIAQFMHSLLPLYSAATSDD